MKAMFIHAHFDDFEFTAGGTFLLWGKKGDVERKVLVVTDGAAGHHFRSRDETRKMRWEEQLASARIGGNECERFQYPDGKLGREGCLELNSALLAGLWKAIRDFEPDYLFVPPLPSDPLAGVHVDHLVVAEAIRRVAYLINVPHAYSEEYPEEKEEFRKTPVILQVYDGYMEGANAFDLKVDVTEVFEGIVDMTFCHQSQVMEWLPWVGRHRMHAPKDREEWKELLKERFERQQREMGVEPGRFYEVFRLTRWGEIGRRDDLVRDFPGDTIFINLG